MPLKDHAKLTDEIQWGSFHTTWAVSIVNRLNESILSTEYKSEPTTHLGPQAEVDIATLERTDGRNLFSSVNGHESGGVAVATATYAPPVPTLTEAVEFANADYTEIKIRRGRWDLVATIELVSKSNKDRAEHRSVFAAKCAGYLAMGVSVVVVDVVTERLAHLHAELGDMLGLSSSVKWKSPTGLSAVCYRTIQGRTKGGGNGQVRLDVWPFALVVGEELPTVPLWLAADLAVPLELELTYAAACKSLRLA